MTDLRTLLLVAALTTTWGVAHAHTEQQKGMKMAPMAMEQMPWGIGGDAQRVTRTVEVRMLDTMRFVPERIDVRQGETVKFVVRNDGKVLHEMVIGNRQSLDEHMALMMKNPGMEHDQPYSTHVSAGKSGDIIWHFNRAGEFEFACLIPGHFQAGMVGRIRVGAAKGK